MSFMGGCEMNRPLTSGLTYIFMWTGKSICLEVAKV
jgi:hypothetical protein